MEIGVVALLITGFVTVYATGSILQWNQTQCTTEKGDECHLPFVYEDVEYYGCTKRDEPRPWCYTEEKRVVRTSFDYCNEDCHTANPEFIKEPHIDSYEDNEIVISCSVAGSPNPSLQWKGRLANDSEVVIKTAAAPPDGPPQLITLKLHIGSDNLYKEVYCRAENEEGKAWSQSVSFSIKGNNSSVNNQETQKMICEPGVRMFILYILLGVIGLLLLSVVVLLVKLKTHRKQSRTVVSKSEISPVAYNKTAKGSSEKTSPNPGQSTKEDKGLVSNSIYISTEDQLYDEIGANADMYVDIPATDDEKRARFNRSAGLMDNELYNT